MLVRTTKRIAGFPPPGEVAEVDDEVALEAIERGDVEDMSSLSARLRRPPEAKNVTGGVPDGELHPPQESTPGPSGDYLGERVGGFLPPKGDETELPIDPA